LRHSTLRGVVESSRLIEQPDIGDSNSLSGSSLRALLKNLARELVNHEAAYVEIGVFRGGTLLDLAPLSPGKFIGIDNFSLFDSRGVNESFIRQRIKNEALQNVELVSLDFEVAVHNFATLFPHLEVGLLMVDGAHDYRSQLLALLGMARHMSAGGVIVVDDANYGHVRQAGYDFVFSNPGWEVACEVLTESHPDRGSKSEWWNGVQILTRSEGVVGEEDVEGKTTSAESVNKIQVMVDRFRQTHEIFRHQLSPVAEEVLDIVRDIGSDTELLATLKKLVQNQSVLARHSTQNVDVETDQVGISYRPSAHLARLKLP